jgi:hypothetical protein
MARRNSNTPYKRKALLASENMLNMVGVLGTPNGNYIEIPVTDKFAVIDNNASWTWSGRVVFNTFNTVLPALFCIGVSGGSGVSVWTYGGYLYVYFKTTTGHKYYRFAVESWVGGTDNATLWAGNVYQVTVIYDRANTSGGYAVPRLFINTREIAVESSSISSWTDSASCRTGTPQILYVNKDFLTGASANSFGSFKLSDAVFFSIAIDKKYIPNLIRGFIPEALHAHVIAHYPLNHNYGLKAWDVSENYNYAKLIYINDNPPPTGLLSFEPTYAVISSTGSDSDGNYLSCKPSAPHVAGSFTRSSFYRSGTGHPGGYRLYKTKIRYKVIATMSLQYRITQFGQILSISGHGSGSIGGPDILLDQSTLNVIREVEVIHVINFSQFNFLFESSSGAYPADAECIRFYQIEHRDLININAHGDLINYTNDEAGVTNPLIQTAWQNIYKKGKKGKFFKVGNGTSEYAEITSLAGYNNAQEDFVLSIVTTIPTSIHSSGLNSLFASRSAADTTDILVSWWSETSTHYNFNISILDDTGSVVISAAPVATFIKSRKNEQVTITFKVTKASGGRDTFIQCIGGNVSFNHGAGVLTKTIGTFEVFRFGRDMHPAYGVVPLAKAVMYRGPVTDRIVNAMKNIAVSDEYKNLGSSALLFDIDFNDIFDSAGTKYARDNSGNNRHAQLYNWTAANQPLLIEQNTGLPERRKALRFTRASSQRLAIANFNPTTEKGYTLIVGFKNREATRSVVPLISWKDPVSGARVVFWDYVGSTSKWTDTAGNFSYDTGTYQYSTGRIDYFAVKVKNRSTGLDYETYLNGGKIGGATSGGFNLITFGATSTLYLGFAVDNGSYAEADFIHTSFFKGYLTQSQIIDIINNGLSGNAAPSLMSDCQLYLNFEEIINDSGTYKIKDWSPQNRTVVLNNYTANEIDPLHADYKLFNLDTLR